MSERPPIGDVERPASSQPPEATRGQREKRASYLAFVDHEAKNPLSTALWSAELLERLPPDERAGERGQKLVGMALRSLKRLRLLVEDYFQGERLELGGLSVEPERVRVADAIESIAKKRPPELGPLSAVVQPDLAVWADRGVFERVLDGLIALSGKEGEPVQVSAAAKGAVARILVAGRKPPEDALADPTRGSASDPTGRGLAAAFARRAARAFGGELAVEGEAWLLTLPAGPRADEDRQA